MLIAARGIEKHRAEAGRRAALQRYCAEFLLLSNCGPRVGGDHTKIAGEPAAPRQIAGNGDVAQLRSVTFELGDGPIQKNLRLVHAKVPFAFAGDGKALHNLVLECAAKPLRFGYPAVPTGGREVIERVDSKQVVQLQD